ncbi:hypothetical protein EGR_09558 [Echinococcus granulosus]|uniref:Secreted protein n=1 Tax=Echinococcus granulosus TaxID=6210 RepID=W6UQB7_ECHGR|nr:hypothetical protein EGR_09558 [Echinococcus granulosus]EUB55579.1 hypothetical protein EGR_09558 [Echinococcus granulosus]
MAAVLPMRTLVVKVLASLVSSSTSISASAKAAEMTLDVMVVTVVLESTSDQPPSEALHYCRQLRTDVLLQGGGREPTLHSTRLDSSHRPTITSTAGEMATTASCLP